VELDTQQEYQAHNGSRIFRLDVPVDSRHFREACGVQQVQVWSKVLTQPITGEVVPFPETPLGKEIEGSSSNSSILRETFVWRQALWCNNEKLAGS
jgi:hypothetical protein